MAMPAVEAPSRKRATVSLTLRPQRRWMAMLSSEPMGRTTKASAKSAKAYSVPVSGLAKGKKSAGKTSTEAMP